MAEFSNYDKLETTNSQKGVVYWLVQTAVAAGWTIQSYGTGTSGSYSSSSAGWSTTWKDSGATRCWVRIQDPAGRREYTFQVIDSSGMFQVRAKFSESSKFTGGSPSANVTPSATDEQVLWGGGTDASPTGASWSAGYPNQHRIHSVANSTPVNGVYPLVVFSCLAGTTTPSSWFCSDPTLYVDTLDASPVASCIGIGWSSPVAGFWFGYGTGSAAWKTQTFATQLCYDATRVVDPNSSNDPCGRFLYYSASGPKGYGYWVWLKAIARAYPNNVLPAGDTRCYFGPASAGLILKQPSGVVLGV